MFQNVFKDPPKVVTPDVLIATLAAHRDSLKRRASVGRRVAGRYLQNVLNEELIHRADLPGTLASVLEHAPEGTPDHMLLALLAPCVPGDDLPEALEAAKVEHAARLVREKRPQKAERPESGVHARLVQQANEAAFARVNAELADTRARLTAIENLLRAAGIEIPATENAPENTPADAPSTTPNAP